MPDVEVSRTLLSSWDPDNEAKDNCASEVRSRYATLTIRYSVWKKKYATGWRSALAMNTGSAVVVLLVNVVFTIVVALGPGFLDWQGTLYEGKCSTSRSMGMFMDVIVNILGTVNSAHAKSIWLDIGMPSTRNLRYISKKRILLWSCLAFSSLPLHLFYNPTIFSSVAVNLYTVIMVEESFAANASLNNFKLHGVPEAADWGPGQGEYERALVHDMQVYAVANQLVRLDNKACIDAWAQDYQTAYSSVLLVAKNSSISEARTPFLE
ncbi:uncharacterized protein BDZ99DRAFT_524432 [Mytilinidion resinicola]|uniref:DUF6536 domain-containing protein n=1 Tax=Mytilinidion resinicola TaxID=574789 RepID=A0A6A6Y9G7_9PEZI|nr:uncharacterized protein BDZ99DRAFT_524432 [Mytilinidion resinicola]KAF2805461.1 hypothetical protein BDZ99DRAFT_524432 [Mytilinidion resinicola]